MGGPSANQNASTVTKTKDKIVMIGSGGVGKSAITLQFVKQKFCSEYDPTIEDSHTRLVDLDGDVSLIEIFDTAGQEELTTLRDAAVRKGDGFILVFSLIDNDSFNQITGHYRRILTVKEADEVPMIVVGNKKDLDNARVISEIDIKELTERLKVKYFEITAKNYKEVEECYNHLVRTMRALAPPPQPDVCSTKKKSKCLLL